MAVIGTLSENDVLFDPKGNPFTVQKTLGTFAALVRCGNSTKKIYREQLEQMMTRLEWEEYCCKKEQAARQARLKWEKDLRQELEGREINQLVHFTKLENLPGILRYGLLSRQELHAGEMQFCMNDSKRLDMHLECSCLSITSPNYRLFYYFRQLDAAADWVVLELTPDVLFSSREYPIFCPSNAASDAVRCRVGEHPAADSTSFQNMFAEEVEYRGRLLQRKNLNLSPCDTTDPQAEILFPGSIPLKYITRINVNNWRALVECQQMVLEHRRDDIDVAVDQQMFSPRWDYTYWRS